MRTVLVTGLGGAGRTTVAAATALAAARSGHRALFLSADPGEILGAPVTAAVDAPAAVEPPSAAERPYAAEGPAGSRAGLWAARIDAGAGFRAEFLALQEQAAAALELLGANRLADEELTELPGSAQFALLRALATAARGEWDLVVLDLPPVREALALLALPEELRRYLRRLLPPERQAARALRPVLAQLAGVPMPARWLYETAARRDAELAEVQALIAAPGTTLRLVAEPGPSAAGALRTARTGLALHGRLAADAADVLVASRVLPRHSSDPWFASLAAQQEKTLQEWRSQWSSGGPEERGQQPYGAVREVHHLGRDPRGPEDLARLGDAGRLGEGIFASRGGEAVSSAAASETARAAGASRAAASTGASAVPQDSAPTRTLAASRDSGSTGSAGASETARDTDTGTPGPDAPPKPSSPPGRDVLLGRVEDRRGEDGTLVWVIELPGADKKDLGLVRRGDELLLRVGPFRRIVPLPSALRRCTVSGAALADGLLRVRFTPDPGQWPRTGPDGPRRPGS